MAAVDARATRLARERREDGGARLGRALGHPLRVSVLEILNSKGPMAPVDIARELRVDLRNLAYHIRVLAKLDCIEVIRRERVGGSVKTTYRSKARALFDDVAWASLSPSVRQEISFAVVQIMSGRIADALTAGTFDSRDDRHLSVSTLTVDPQGWEEISELVAGVFHRLKEVEEESARRDTPTLPMSVALVTFESPHGYE